MSEYALSYTGAEVNELLSTVDEVADYIIAEGTSGMWYWRKWASGVAECWCKKSISVSGVSTAWGSWYYHEKVEIGSFPFAFMEMPSVVVFNESGTEGVIMNGGDCSATSAPSVYIARPGTFGVTSYIVGVIAKGRWK